MVISQSNPVAMWTLLVGSLLIAMALSNTAVKRLPLSGAIIYLLVGYGLANTGWNSFNPNPYTDAGMLARIAEVALLISLFSAGLKLRLPLNDARWWLSLRLASLSMLATVGLLAALAVGLGLPLGLAILIGAILAPTDPVLASDVQVEHASDSDKLRFSLTGESGLNDGTAFPFVVAGLGLLQASISMDFAQWILRDLLWSIGGGIGVGAAAGYAIGHLVMYLRTRHKVAVGLDEFLVLGLIAVAYGGALLLHTSTFLSVFAAAIALGRIPELHNPEPLPTYALEKMDELATSPAHAGSLMMRALLGFNEQLERIAEVIIVILVGALIPYIHINFIVLALVIALIFIIRPLSVALGLLGSPSSATQRRLMAWFGIRGIGSIYYLFYVLNQPVVFEFSDLLLSITLTAVVVSVVVHGISVTPLMALYKHRRSRATKHR